MGKCIKGILSMIAAHSGVPYPAKGKIGRRDMKQYIIYAASAKGYPVQDLLGQIPVFSYW